jgi:outer membrane protein TolC
MHLNSAELLNLVRQNNPGVKANQSALAKQEVQVASAKREGKPDFDVSYMYQNTDRKYRDYYMFTLNVRLPRKGRVDAQVAEAVEMQAQAKSALDAQLQQQLAAAQQQYVQAVSDNELLTDYRDGLIPQSEAAYRASLSAYATNKEQFVHVLQYFTGLLDLRLELAKTVADHEIALGHLESLTGANLR